MTYRYLGMQGRVLADRYQLDRVIGKGAMGTVWHAEHLALGMPVAVKLIHAEAARNDGAMSRFRREARVAARIRSAHVVQMLDHGDDDAQPFIVMEWLEGETLQERLERVRRLDPLDTARVVTHVSRALSQAHAKGLVHRDIKPENVFAVPGEDGGPDCFKVLDFGVAKVFDDIDTAGALPTRTGALLGTPFYLSPEQARGLKSLDHRADLWSLAVLTYECLTGELPFAGKTLGLLVAQIMDAPIRPPTEVAPDAELPKEVDDWFLQALAREPRDRFQSARELADAFRIAAGAAETAPDDRWSDAGPPVQVEDERKTTRGIGLMDSQDAIRTVPGALAAEPDGPSPTAGPEPESPPAAEPAPEPAAGHAQTVALPPTPNGLAPTPIAASPSGSAALAQQPAAQPTGDGQAYPSRPLVQGPSFSNAGADAVHPYEELRARSIPPSPSLDEQRLRRRIRLLVAATISLVGLVGAGAVLWTWPGWGAQPWWSAAPAGSSRVDEAPAAEPPSATPGETARLGATQEPSTDEAAWGEADPPLGAASADEALSAAPQAGPNEAPSPPPSATVVPPSPADRPSTSTEPSTEPPPAPTTLGTAPSPPTPTSPPAPEPSTSGWSHRRTL